MWKKVTLQDLIDLHDHDDIIEWATRLKAEFEQFVTSYRLEISATNGLWAVVDVTDFLLRVIEDDCLADPAVRSGEDERAVHHVNVAIAALNAPDTATGIRALTSGEAGVAR